MTDVMTNEQRLLIAEDIVNKYAQLNVEFSTQWKAGLLSKMNEEFSKGIKSLSLDEETEFFVAERLKGLGCCRTAEILGINGQYKNTKTGEYWETCRKEMDKFFGVKSKSKSKSKSDLSKALFG